MAVKTARSRLSMAAIHLIPQDKRLNYSPNPEAECKPPALQWPIPPAARSPHPRKPMALLPIIEFPDPRLRTVAKPVEHVDAALSRLIDDMLDRKSVV